MKLITLRFQSPSSLNKSEETIVTKNYYWSHASYKGFNNGLLELNLLTWEITCPEMNINGPIILWEVSEQDYTMKLRTDNVEGNFKPLDYTFAVSMLGQLLPKSKLIEYLSSLREAYSMSLDSPSNNLID